MAAMTRERYFLRLGICVFMDVVDFTIGRMPGLGGLGEAFGSVAMFLMWGFPGLFYAGELLDPTEQIDGFIPTATLIALAIGLKDGHLLGRTPADRDRMQTP